ncbi:MAG: hypothetical protein MHM6MM_001972 [Cercozoa sp. M6MM]
MLTSRNMSTLRHAEKSRVSSCARADLVARAAIDAFRLSGMCDHVGTERQMLAAVVFEDAKGMHVVSLGSGTKYLTIKHMKKNMEHLANLVCDCHAEILAYRAFQRFLLHQVASFDKDNNSFLVRQNGKYTLRPDVTVHFYASSAPCGNSVVKKYAKAKKIKATRTFAEIATAHSRLQVTDAAQVAFSVKKDADFDFHSTDEKVPSSTIPLPCVLEAGCIHSCSDKIALWNCLGLQGRLLSEVIQVHIDTVTVGRKFGDVFLRRALCCRFQDFTNKKNRRLMQLNETHRTSYFVHHPVIMCTGVKLDDGIVDQTDVALFTDACAGWCRGEDVEVLNGTSGLTVGGNVSRFSDNALASLLEQQMTDAVGFTVYDRARSLLLAHKFKFFNEWRTPYNLP